MVLAYAAEQQAPTRVCTVGQQEEAMSHPSGENHHMSAPNHHTKMPVSQRGTQIQHLGKKKEVAED